MTRTHYDDLLRQLDDAVLDLGGSVVEALTASMRVLEDQDLERATRLIEADTVIDRKRQQIEQDCLTIIATQQPAAGDLRTITGTLTIATELERIGDYCEGIAKITLRMAGEPLLSPFEEIQGMAVRTERSLREALRAFAERNIIRATAVWAGDDVVDSMYETVFRDLLARMAGDPTTVRRGTYLLWVAHNLERMADRATNIVESVAFIITGNPESFRSAALAQTLPR